MLFLELANLDLEIQSLAVADHGDVSRTPDRNLCNEFAQLMLVLHRSVVELDNDVAALDPAFPAGLSFLVPLAAWSAGTAAQPLSSFSNLGGEIVNDSRWFVDTLQLDVEDIATFSILCGGAAEPAALFKILPRADRCRRHLGDLVRLGQNHPESRGTHGTQRARRDGKPRPP